MTKCFNIISSARALCAGILLALLAASAHGAEPAALVQPLGEFAKVRATEDHTYGHRAQLWRSGGRLLGEIMYWDGNIEGQRGRFVDGAYDQRTGAVTFKTVVVRRDLQPNRRAQAAFEGHIVKGTLTGKLTWAGDKEVFFGAKNVERLVLPLQPKERLTTYASIEAWQKANTD